MLAVGAAEVRIGNLLASGERGLPYRWPAPMSNRRWVLSPPLTVGFALAFSLLVAAAVSVRLAQVETAGVVATVEGALEVIDQTDVVLARLVDAESGQRGYLLTGAERYLTPYEAALAALPIEIATLHDRCAGRPDTEGDVARLDQLARAMLDELHASIERRRRRSPDAPFLLAEMDAGKEKMDGLRAVVAALRAAARSDLHLHRMLLHERRTRTRAAITGTIAGAALLAGVILLALNRQTRQRMVVEAEWERARRAEMVLAERDELLQAAEQARADAERASKRARRLVEANVIGVVFGEGEIMTEANDAFLAVVGYARADLEAGPLSWRELTPPEHRPLDDRALDELAGRGASAPYEKEFIRKDGTRVPVLLGAASLGGPGSEEWVCFIVDLTERHRALAALRAARAQAEAANRAKDEFLAVLSHEMRSPLHATLGWLSILKSGLAQGRDVSRAIATVERNARLQTQIVDDLLDVSRIVAGKLAIAVAPLELPAVVSTAVESVRPAAEAKGLTLTCTIALPGGFVIGDEARLCQVLGNLLGNAVKFTPSGGRVSVSLTSDGGQAVLQIRDTGAGIAPGFLPHVFERFRQADASTTRAHGGLGIGLYLVKTLVELHGGFVAVSSEGPGKGATFTVRLPLEVASPAPSAARVAVAETAPRELADVTVLLVEDEPDSRDALRMVLEHAGAEVHACGSAAEARRALEQARPDVIVSDIGMPGETGHAFLQWVRAQGGPRVPAVALTGFASLQDGKEAARSGFDAHLAKPVPADVLVAMLLEMARARGTGQWESGTIARTVRRRAASEA